ncbi:ABC-F family ATP-binding cassette domain-containing protein [Methylopila sp. Yamaguchi]|uniref:ABC-F family ATP-binding cassette domain-containing protein n=1 Tax=Methylopila sp. Yamaguchi TaxID=1437817 RepID=UPI000CAB8C4E|nr:ABC-F family ATP-binding cassette domain-containing protein [Methylopila sp. Yamaguchi]GBD49045.1 ABC transporter related protein [Methylopila sp. Yamaguchi]
MIQITDLTCRVAGRVLLDNASAFLPEGARVGVVGRNGTGKTTLFKLLAGDIGPDDGVVNMPKGLRLGRVAQEAPSGPEPLIEVVLAADKERAALMAESETCTDPERISDIVTRLIDIDAYEAPSRAARILSGLGFDDEAQQRPCSDFSGGWRMRVALAAVLFSEPDLLLLDEPTNHLDLEGTLWLQDYLAKYPRTTLVISHDRDLLNASVDHILHFDQGKLTVWKGNYDAFDRMRREKLALDQKAAKAQAEERARLEAFIARFKAKASKATQAQSRVKRLAKMQPINAVVESSVVPFRIPEPERELAPPLVALDGVSAGYGDRTILHKLNIRIDPDDRIALLGSNGNGKSTFAKLLANRLQASAGRVNKSEKMLVGFFAQHHVEDLDVEGTPYDHIRRLMPTAGDAQVRGKVAQIGFPGDKANTKVGKMSGGEKARLAFGLAVWHAPHLLILDEPTNHLDIDSRESLAQALNEYAGAVILISHDRHLLDATADRLWVVGGGGVEPFDGDLDDYRKYILSAEGSGKSKKVGKGTGMSSEPAPKRIDVGALKKKIASLEELMATCDQEMARIDAELTANGGFPGKPQKAAALGAKRAEVERAKAEAEETWLEASASIEDAAAA